MKFAIPTVALIALCAPTTSAWRIWVNWANNCGGDSYYTQGSQGRACLNILPRSDGSLPRSFTWGSSGESGCVATIFNSRNCAVGTVIDSTKVDGTCLLGRFQIQTQDMLCTQDTEQVLDRKANLRLYSRRYSINCLT